MGVWQQIPVQSPCICGWHRAAPSFWTLRQVDGGGGGVWQQVVVVLSVLHNQARFRRAICILLEPVRNGDRGLVSSAFANPDVACKQVRGLAACTKGFDLVRTPDTCEIGSGSSLQGQSGQRVNKSPFQLASIEVKVPCWRSTHA